MEAKLNIYPANAVRVWRGFRSNSLNQTDFFNKLSTVFVPATVEMQKEVGLDVYIPTIPCGMLNKPATVPDETAILFWNSQQTYQDGFNTLAVRTYTLTHSAVYTAESRADFPVLFNGTLVVNQPYILFNKSIDWMHGNVQHLVGDFVNTKQNTEKVCQILNNIQTRSKVDAAIVCIGENYLVYWQLNGATDSGLDELKDICQQWSSTFKPANYTIPAGLWDAWTGMQIQPGNSFNMQFKRAWEL